MEIYIVVERNCCSSQSVNINAYTNKGIAEAVAERLTKEKGYYKEDEYGKDWRTWFEVESVRLMGMDKNRLTGGV